MEKELKEILKDYMTARQIELAMPRVLRLFNVIGQSEQLKAFAKYWNKTRADFVEIEDEDIDEFLRL